MAPETQPLPVATSMTLRLVLAPIAVADAPAPLTWLDLTVDQPDRAPQGPAVATPRPQTHRHARRWFG